MRLIDADSLLEEMKSDKWCEDYLGEDVSEGIYDYVEQAPTAFDLESVIFDISERLQERMEYYGNDFNPEAKAYRECLEILKSAANATNGKNGG